MEAVEALCRRWSAAASVVELGPGEVVLSLPGGADAAGLAEAARMLPVAGHVVAAAVEGGAVVVRLEPLPDEPPEGERAAPPADPEDLSSEVR